MITVDQIDDVHQLHRHRWGATMSYGLAMAIGRKVAEEATELAMETARSMSDSDLNGEIGDVLFAAIAACRITGANPGELLAATIEKNRERWR